MAGLRCRVRRFVRVVEMRSPGARSLVGIVIVERVMAVGVMIRAVVGVTVAESAMDSVGVAMKSRGLRGMSRGSLIRLRQYCRR